MKNCNLVPTSAKCKDKRPEEGDGKKVSLDNNCFFFLKYTQRESLFLNFRGEKKSSPTSDIELLQEITCHPEKINLPAKPKLDDKNEMYMILKDHLEMRKKRLEKLLATLGATVFEIVDIIEKVKFGNHQNHQTFIY